MTSENVPTDGRVGAAVRFLWGAPKIFGALVLTMLVVGFLSCSVLIVPRKHVAILIRKTGNDLPEGQMIAMKSEQKGIQYPVVLEGWHFYNAYTWDWRIVPQVVVPEGKVGIRVRRFGKPLSAGKILVAALPADASPEVLRNAHRGVLRNVLRPGRHASIYWRKTYRNRLPRR